MKTIIPLATAASLLVLGTAANAADAIFYDPLSGSYDWSGAYVGVHGGGTWSRLRAAGVPGSVGVDGGLLGVFGGFNLQYDSFVFGAEGDVGYNWNRTNVLPAVGLFPGANVGTDWNGSLRARAGFAFDRTLVYGTGGAAWTRGYAQVPGVVTARQTFSGWTLGAGVEHAFMDEWTGRVEYRYADFGRNTIAGVPGFRVHEHTLRVGIGYKF